MSGPLKNARQERFAQELAKGSSAIAAYTRAGYKPCDAHASRLAGNGKVADRVGELLQRAADRAEVTAAEVIRELRRIGFSDIRKVVRWQSNIAVAAPNERSLDEIMDEGPGEVRHAITNQVELVDSTEIDDDTAAAIAEISQTDKGGLKIKLHDKRAALVDLGRHLGIFKDKIAIVGGNPAEGDAPIQIAPADAYRMLKD